MEQWMRKTSSNILRRQELRQLNSFSMAIQTSRSGTTRHFRLSSTAEPFMYVPFVWDFSLDVSSWRLIRSYALFAALLVMKSIETSLYQYLSSTIKARNFTLRICATLPSVSWITSTLSLSSPTFISTCFVRGKLTASTCVDIFQRKKIICSTTCRA